MSWREDGRSPSFGENLFAYAPNTIAQKSSSKTHLIPKGMGLGSIKCIKDAWDIPLGLGRSGFSEVFSECALIVTDAAFSS
jgi:hypothetical protein